MNDTFSEFMEFLKKNRDEIRNDLLMPYDSPRRMLYSEVFRRNYITEIPEVPFGKEIAATDSTETVRELYNGKKLILIRSYSVLGTHRYASFIPLVISVGRDDVQRFLTMLMEHSEHMSMLKLLEERKPDYLLVDGSISGRINRQRRPLVAEGYEQFHEEYSDTLSKLLDRSAELSIPLVFMAKSSESRVFREFLLQELGRTKLQEDIIRAEHETRLNDHYLVKSLASSAGYTRPLAQRASLRTTFGEKEYTYNTTHLLPDPKDLPVKMDVYSGKDGIIEDDILSLAFWGYGDIKVHNIWLADADRLVKFRNDEVEGIYMRAFEKEIGISLYETRGERRARIRI